MEIISSKGTLTGEDIKADQCYLLLAYLILNHKKNFSVDTLAEIICPYDELDSPYKIVNTAAKPYLALEHAEVIKKYLHIK